MELQKASSQDEELMIASIVRKIKYDVQYFLNWYVTVQQELQTPFIDPQRTKRSLDSLDCVLCAAIPDWSIQPLLITSYAQKFDDGETKQIIIDAIALRSIYHLTLSLGAWKKIVIPTHPATYNF